MLDRLFNNYKRAVPANVGSQDLMFQGPMLPKKYATGTGIAPDGALRLASGGDVVVFKPLVSGLPGIQVPQIGGQALTPR